MTEKPPQRQPGDVILDHYMPHASDAEREAARENLYAFASVILEICTRLARESRDNAIRARADNAVKSGSEP